MDHRFMRPPPSGPLPPPPPGPPPGPPPPQQQQQDNNNNNNTPWYSPSPPPPPPQHSQQPWAPQHAPPPHSYPPHPGPPYPPPPQSYQQQPPPLRPPQPYPSQDWGHASWNHHPGWEYPAQSNEEDLVARARAWAARSAMENQNPQSQFSTGARPEESSQYSNQYSQPFESQYQDTQQTSIPTSGFSNYPAPGAPLNRPPMVHPQDPASISSYSSDGHFSFAAKDGALGVDASSGFSHHQVTTNSSVYQQEVPSSYSSIPGREDGSGVQRHGHSFLPADPRALPVEQTQFVYGNHMDPMDQPLEFASRFSHENDQTMKPSYPDSAGPLRGLNNSAAASLNAWTAPVGPNVSYPSVTSAFPSAPQQHDPSLGVPPLPGQPASMFPRGPAFQSTVPSMLPPVGLGAAAVHPSSAFPVDAYGAVLSSERPKKAAVPNWLREEIIKKKPAITSSIPDQFKDGSQSTEDDSIDKSIVKGDQADSKSLDSSRSTEEEEDDEDYEEAQRTAAINQEIKRIVTEVLLKVTDEFFDEIATKVLGEDDHDVDGTAEPDNHVPNHKVLPPPPPVPAAKASAEVLVPVREFETGSPSGDSSQLPGNVLGLANYSSDDDDGDNQTSKVAKSDVASGRGATGENGHSRPEAEEHNSTLVDAEGDHDMSTTSLGKKGDRLANDGKLLIKSDIAKSSENSNNTSLGKLEAPADRRNTRKPIEEDSRERDARRYDRHDSKRSSHGRDTLKQTDSRKSGEDEEKHGRKEEKHQKKEKTGDHNSSKERSNEQVSKTKDKVKESDSRKRSPDRYEKDSKKERERDKKATEVDRADRKRERSKDEKGDKSRHKSSRDGDRHKRRRSSSVDSRGKRSKESPVASDNSSDEASQDSRRRGRSKRRDLSPSPVKSKRRQVSRSPHSKHTQRRQSPYSSLDGSRGKKSRSRSPVRRRR